MGALKRIECRTDKYKRSDGKSCDTSGHCQSGFCKGSFVNLGCIGRCAKKGTLGKEGVANDEDKPFTVNTDMTQLKEMSHQLRGSGPGDEDTVPRQVTEYATSDNTLTDND